ncbi:DEAD/DEAH box helicase [Acidimangrovimonas sediminis]|uniref:DEAD/DEAH box helicase n=1 Tax=Acidimangrovimonas sediminis TaxID=2056283 RepID=UPI000C7FE985|nr:DEAD/DEAH box helicase [Acidimangrovimonas sediminis]
MLPPLSEALSERGYATLTPVQEAVIAPALEGQDLLVSAQTGSGKTVGFGLALAPTLLGENHQFGPAATPLGLIIAPTRELAFQVMQELRWLYAKTGAQVTSCVGGMDPRNERRALERGSHIVVGTPGRLRDHIERGALDLSDIRAVVLDEADEMLDLGFREDLEFILGTAPEERRTLLFSATVSPMIAKLAGDFQKDAQRVDTRDKGQQHADISYRALRVAASDRDHAIFNLLRYHDAEGAIIFANTRAAVNHLSARLSNRGLSVVTLSGELSQAERSHALQAMRDGRARVCVATDVAARGIDLPGLSLVIHADLPSNTESLLHRSGRTGRAGRKGISALIVGPREIKKAQRLLNWAKIDAEWDVPPSADEIVAKDEERLLNDPALTTLPTEAEADFAARLLAVHAPEAIAAAWLRSHQAKNGAPEDLLPPDAGPKREHVDFGPSRWFALSVGRDDRAEPRWLLPMLLRKSDLGRSDVGAIRVQDTQTFVEIAEAAAPKLLALVEAGETLDDNIRLSALDAAPDLGPRTGTPRGERQPGRPGDRGPRQGGPRHDGPKPRRPRDGEGGGPDKPWKKPRREDAPPRPEREPARAERPAPRDEAPAERPERRAPRDAAFSNRRLSREDFEGTTKPRAKYGAAPGSFDGDRPKGKPAGKPTGKPTGKFGDKPAGKFGGKPGSKFGAKPGAKFGAKPGAGGDKVARGGPRKGKPPRDR